LLICFNGTEKPLDIFTISHCYYWLPKFNSAVVLNLPEANISLSARLSSSNVITTVCLQVKSQVYTSDGGKPVNINPHQRKKLLEQRQDNTDSTPRDKAIVVCGIRKNTTLPSDLRRHQLFIFHVHNDILKFLESDDIDVSELERVSRDHSWSIHILGES